MKSETIELEFVNDLMTEARMFRSDISYPNIQHVIWLIMFCTHDCITSNE